MWENPRSLSDVLVTHNLLTYTYSTLLSLSQ